MRRLKWSMKSVKNKHDGWSSGWGRINLPDLLRQPSYSEVHTCGGPDSLLLGKRP